MKILITGTHFTPAVATIEELKKFKDIEIVYVGRNTTLEGDKSLSAESKVIPSLGVKFIPLIVGRLQRSFTLYTIPSLLKIPIGFIQALYIILSQKPDLILSFGGYVSVPIVLAGWLWSVPVIVHEQTLTPGLANRISSFFADKIAVSFDNKILSSDKVILTGNPVRKELLEYKDFKTSHSNKHLPKILVIGGNQGSHTINLVVEKILDKLTKIAQVIHQTGDSKYKDFERLSQKENENYKVSKFINNDWAKVLSQADLVISRAGINSLTELTFLGKPTLLIPIPGYEQKTNAQYFAKIGLANVIPQSQLTPDLLFDSIKSMLKNLAKWEEKAKFAKKVVIPDAAKRLALEIMLMFK